MQRESLERRERRQRRQRRQKRERGSDSRDRDGSRDRYAARPLARPTPLDDAQRQPQPRSLAFKGQQVAQDAGSNVLALRAAHP
jgi:hypothetical protein